MSLTRKIGYPCFKAPIASAQYFKKKRGKPTGNNKNESHLAIRFLARAGLGRYNSFFNPGKIKQE